MIISITAHNRHCCHFSFRFLSIELVRLLGIEGTSAMAPKLATKRRPPYPKTLKVGSDYSGVDTCCVALKRMGVAHTVEFTSDTDAACRSVLKAVHNPNVIFEDALERTPSEETYVDLYMWTPPCQDLSSLGKKQGTSGTKNRLAS